MIELTPSDVDNLRYAIVMQAVMDYKGLLMNEFNACRDCRIDEVERFFKSSWYELLFDMDGEYLMRVVRNKVEEYKKEGKRISFAELSPPQHF